MRARKRTSFWLESAIVVVDIAGRVVAKMSKVTEINKRNVRRFINLQSGEALNSLNKNNHDNFSNFSFLKAFRDAYFLRIRENN